MDYVFLTSTPLFCGMSPQEVEQMLSCLAAVTRTYHKGETVFRAGECVCTAGLVLRGSVTVESDDFWGNRSILSRAAPGDLFGEAYACLPEQPLLVSVVAAENCEILLLDVARALHVCSNACAHHSRIVQNLLALCAEKNLQLSQRMLHTAPKTIRARLLSYFGELSQRAGSSHFSLPYDRQALADYLNVDRSAMCAELSKMKADGLIDYTKSTVTLHPEHTL